MSAELNEKELAMILTMVKMVEMNQKENVQPAPTNARFYYDGYLKQVRQYLKPPLLRPKTFG